MKFNHKNVIKYLDRLDFESLFIEELGWDYPDDNQHKYITIDEQIFTLTPIAHKCNFNVYQCLLENQSIPLSPILKNIDREISKYSYEHFIIYTSDIDKIQKWQWVKKETNQPLVNRIVEYSSQKKERLLLILEAITISLEEEANLTLLDVSARTKKAFDVDKVTKKFYDKFKKEHSQFLSFIQGINIDFDKQWYASLMLNRLMFVYFLQKKGFLNDDINYLKNQLTNCQQQKGKDKFYSFYNYFLLKLFHDGLGSQNRTEELDNLLGKVPYLNGGLFEIHPLENKYPNIDIKDEAFEKIFTFFDQYNWHLDDRPLKSDKEINPDVLGYIFEKYINQKQMGAYYTKEDITEYISKNCIIPYLFDAVLRECEPPQPPLLRGENSLEESLSKGDLEGFQLLQKNPDRYIYDAVKKGVNLPLPDDIAKGINDVSQRENWNQTAHENYSLPTEIWREVIARRNRYFEVKAKLIKGEITSINDLITYNLNIRQFAQDVISHLDSPLTLKIFYEKLSTMSILDPTCGSGAFLFSALNILEPLYEGCLEKMQEFVDKPPLTKGGVQKIIKEFQGILANVRSHVNKKYFILKNIILNNLYGVDIMEEATEVCKLRLFLKLASQISTNSEAKNYGIEPLPDIDFNIRSGNSLVGFANYNEVEKSVKGDRQGKLDLYDDMAIINDKAKAVSEVYQTFRHIQTQSDGANFKETKQKLQHKLNGLNEELNQYLAKEYGIDIKKKKDYEKWLTSHQPFHWFTEFYSIINNGGFDVIIGNPPYVEYSKVKKDYQIKGYETEKCNDLYAYTIELALKILNNKSFIGMIIPISFVSANGFENLRNIIKKFNRINWISSYAMRPSKLFDGADKHLSIWISSTSMKNNQLIYSTKYYRWTQEERDYLFANINYIVIATNLIYLTSIPKLGSDIELNIFNKLVKTKITLGQQTNNQGQYHLFYTRKLRYFVQFLDIPPKMINSQGTIEVTSELKKIYFVEEIDKNISIAVYLSSLFFWYFLALSDCRNVNKREVINFPINLKNISNKNKLEKLSKELMQNLQSNSEMKSIKYANKGIYDIQFFSPKLSKQIIDEIDKILAQHYGFSDEELDFIINYDIKYRMGKELDSD